MNFRQNDCVTNPMGLIGLDKGIETLRRNNRRYVVKRGMRNVFRTHKRLRYIDFQLGHVDFYTLSPLKGVTSSMRFYQLYSSCVLLNIGAGYRHVVRIDGYVTSIRIGNGSNEIKYQGEMFVDKLYNHWTDNPIIVPPKDSESEEEEEEL